METKLVFKDNVSNKFWNITVKGSKHIIHYGRVGTKGNLHRDSYHSNQYALESAHAKIRSKKRKGYVEVAYSPTPTFNSNNAKSTPKSTEYNHITSGGKELLLKDITDTHLANIITILENIASGGISIVTKEVQKGLDEHEWVFEYLTTLKGEEALKHLNYYKYTKEKQRRRSKYSSLDWKKKMLLELQQKLRGEPKKKRRKPLKFRNSFEVSKGVLIYHVDNEEFYSIHIYSGGHIRYYLGDIQRGNRIYNTKEIKRIKGAIDRFEKSLEKY